MSATDTTAAGAVSALNSLLRGELAAVDTYEQAVGKFESRPVLAQELRRLRDQHRDSARVLREHVAALGGDPAESGGAWGTLVTTLTGAAKLLGPETVLAALRQGEEQGIADYKKALDRDRLAGECRAVVAADLLPRCERHLAELEAVRQSLAE